jgi:hypothetical protein
LLQSMLCPISLYWLANPIRTARGTTLIERGLLPPPGRSCVRSSNTTMLALSALLRQAGRVPPGLALASCQRAFGATAHEVATTDGNPFLRFSTPFPKAIDHTPLLTTLPETQVRDDRASALRVQLADHLANHAIVFSTLGRPKCRRFALHPGMRAGPRLMIVCCNAANALICR